MRIFSVKSRKGFRGKAALSAVFAMLGAVLVAGTPAALAAEVPVGEAPGRGVGSGQYGYVGQFGTLNSTTQPGALDFYYPYGVAIQGDRIVVADSGRTSWEDGNKVAGHSLQSFTLSGDRGFALGTGDYVGNGTYDDTTHESTKNPQSLVTPEWQKYYPVGESRGSRGVAIDSQGNTYVVLSERADGDNFIYKYAPDGTFLLKFGRYTPPGALGWPVGISVDADDNVYVTSAGIGAVFAFDSNGTYRSGWSIYWADGTNLLAGGDYTVPGFLNEPQGVTVDIDTGDVYVGDLNSSFTRQGRITKLSVEKTSDHNVTVENNPAGWTWSLDSGFGTNGYVNRGVLSKVFALGYDQQSNELLTSSSVGTITRISSTGTVLGTIGESSGPVHSDGRMAYARGVAVDSKGLTYVTTQGTTAATNPRAVVQVFAKTPSPVPSVTATEGDGEVKLTWANSPQGYGQVDVLDYTVEYSTDNGATWTLVPASPSTALTRTVTGLNNGQTYDFRVTAYSEAGSGDPAVTQATPRETLVPQLQVTKTPAPGTVVTAAGDTITWDIVVQNKGTDTLTDVTVTDSAADKLTLGTWPGAEGVLAPGESVTATATSTVTAALFETGKASNTVNGSGVGAQSGTTVTESANAEVTWTVPSTAPPVPSTAPSAAEPLPQTGSDVMPWLALSILVVLVGSALVLVTRRRRTANANTE